MAKSETCIICKKPATKMVLWADGRGYQSSCADHVKATQDMLTKKNGKMTELAGVKDLAVSSRVYPDLERSPGKNDNWVEKAGGLPDYIERIAKHLHYERGFTISRAIATAVNTVKRWARKGSVAKYGSTENVTVATQAKAAAALAQWEAKKASTKISLSAILVDSNVVDLSEAMVNLQLLADRANAVADPEARAVARRSVLDLAARTKDGRKSYKNQGKWKHGFIPVDKAAKQSKAKGSPIALKRINRLYGGAKTQDRKVTVERKGGGTRTAKTTGQLRGVEVKDVDKHNKVQVPSVANRGKRTRAAEKPWNEIPAAEKTIRNGKRYVLTTFNGKVRLTEWQGNVDTVDTTDKANRRYASITSRTLEQFTTGELQRLLDVPGQPAAVKKKIRKAMNDAREAKRNVA